jgi:CDP-glucose 4,6-dehydratase
LTLHGAKVVGLSLPVPVEAAELRSGLTRPVLNLTGDVTDYAAVLEVVQRYQPEVVFHLAAQALVLPGYEYPLTTIATNVLGTAHVLEALRTTGCAQCCVVVTSDKCYSRSPGAESRAHAEGDPLGGDDPYSASKAAAEVVTHAYWRSFGGTQLRAVATARAGNILGGGDLAPDRIVPDWARSVRDKAPLHLRHPDSIRPWQHVLDALAGYLLLADALMDAPSGYAGAWNFGPPETSVATVRQVIDELQQSWSARTGDSPVPVVVDDDQAKAPERAALTLDSSRAAANLAWAPRLDLHDTAAWTTEWYAAAWRNRRFDGASITSDQIVRYLDLFPLPDANPAPSALSAEA